MYLNNEKNIMMFLFFYKSFLFKKTEFKTDLKDKQINIIINALNIKDRKKRIEFVYDETCKYIDNLYNNKNICEFENDQCFVQKNTDQFNGCCKSCQYLINRTCTTNNIADKVFFCKAIRKKHSLINYKDLKVLKIFTLHQRLTIQTNYRKSREYVLNKLYKRNILFLN